MPAAAPWGPEELTGRVVVLAGPGVVDDGALDALRDFAAAGSLGVANTWGAKGVFAWDSPHHLGTCGLQADDFALLGFAEADTILVTGLDRAESPRDRVALAPILDVAPGRLRGLVGRVHATAGPTNDLYARLSAIARPGYLDPKVPLHPARAAADLGAMLPDGGLVAAEPGLAGLWIARTFPTPALRSGEPRRVVVPARRDGALAVRAALDAARSGRPAIYVTAGEPDDATHAELESADREGLDLVVLVWHPDGALADVDEYASRLRAALATPGRARVDVPVALGDTRALVEAAGPVVAWGGLTPSELAYA